MCIAQGAFERLSSLRLHVIDLFIFPLVKYVLFFMFEYVSKPVLIMLDLPQKYRVV